MTERQWMLLLLVTVVAISAAVVYQDKNRIQSLEAERSTCTDERDRLAFEASELNQQVTQLKEKQRETDRKSRISSAKLIALEEDLVKLEDERTALDDERDRLKIREKNLKEQLDDLRSQLKASESATNEEKRSRLKAESKAEKKNREATMCNVLLDTALSVALGKEILKAPTTVNANYKTHPMLIKEFKTRAALETNAGINGIAKLNEDLFVITAGSNVIERFDSASLSTTRSSTLLLKGSEYFQDLQSCNRSQSLFVISQESTDQKFISNVDPYNRKIISTWEVDSCISELSVSENCHVFVTCYDESKIIEYSSNGHLIQEIVLKPETGIIYPRRALKMANGNVLVCYDGKTFPAVAAVAIVNYNGDVLKSYSDPLKTPGMVVAMDIDRLGNILVAEKLSQRVMLFSPDLEYKRDIVTKEHGTRFIHAMLLDEVNGRLFVTDSDLNIKDRQFENGRIMVFDLK